MAEIMHEMTTENDVANPFNTLSAYITTVATTCRYKQKSNKQLAYHAYAMNKQSTTPRHIRQSLVSRYAWLQY